ncbi:ferritin-like domain-containing protein [Mesobacillus foraminis]|uniref:Rubrerythrin family protein n=1 Tax=Mesobacillus foraminis TaxID=279826 RepID=A0A4R2BGL2_9BACI|nr:ferritin-like domain-containing protein [Mesobacillus foraminis]TCN25996.1 hypothetical protein EV146_104103 [Mesobacillus foraminis]
MDQTQAQIPYPPRAITTKDILYLKDALSWELLAFKKFHFLAEHAENPEIKAALDKAGKLHQDHFERLLIHFQVDNNAAMSSLPNTNKPN